MRRDLTTSYPASKYVGIEQSISYGASGKTILASTAGIVDTGTTLTLISSGKSCSGLFHHSEYWLLRRDCRCVRSVQSRNGRCVGRHDRALAYHA